MTQQKPLEEEHVPATSLPVKESPDVAQAAEAAHLAQEIIDSIRKPLLVLGSGMRVQTANRSFYQLFQMQQADVEQRCFYHLDGDQWDIPRLHEMLENVWVQEMPPEDLEMHREFPRIGLKTLLIYVRRLVHQGENSHLILLVIEDITERRRAERLLAEIELYAQNIVDTVREPLLMLDPALRVRSANRAFYQTFQVSPEETENRLIYELGNGQWDIPALRTLLEDIIPQRSVFNDYELEHEFPSIGRRVMLLNARELRAGNHTELLVLSLEDVTERRSAERRLQIHVQKLEWSNRELQDFAYIASHDLQEPLRAIQAFGERLKTRAGDGLNEESRDYLERMLRAASRMRVLIHDLLEFSRVTTKARPFAPVDLTLVAQQALADLATRCEETQGRVEVGPLPTLEADATQIRQLLQNLIDNGLKYGRDGVPPVVTISNETLREEDVLWAEGRDMCRIEVRDNGIGFEEKYADRIFAPFQRLHSRGRYDGTGIGLAICRKIVERHDGRILAQSVVGEGSLFTIMLPVHQIAGE